MTFSITTFDTTPAAGFKRVLTERRERNWAHKAMAAEEENMRRPVRRILLKAFPKEFLARIEPALQGDAFVLFARPLNLLIDFAEAGGIALNHPGQWQHEKMVLRPSDFLMRRLNAAYRNDPRYSPKEMQDHRDCAVFHLAVASILIPIDTQAMSYLRPRLRLLTRGFLYDRQNLILKACMGRSGIAPILPSITPIA